MIKNESGVRPVRYSVIVLPDVLEEKTSGGIIKTDRQRELEQNAQVKGTLVALGGSAFDKSGYTDDERALLIPGARVYFAKYGEGIEFEGADAREYRMMQDLNISGFIEHEMAVPVVYGRNRAKLDARA